jgi:hypothetical protein
MADNTVQVATTSQGSTIVVANQTKGWKKYVFAASCFVVTAILHEIQKQYPNAGETLQNLLNLAQTMGLLGTGLSFTSPFDHHGVVLTDGGVQLSPPQGPSGPSGLASLLLVFCLLTVGAGMLTGCAQTNKALKGVLGQEDSGSTVTPIVPAPYYVPAKSY